MTNDETKPQLTEAEAAELAMTAVMKAGGTKYIYRNPRHPFAINPTADFVIDGHAIEVRPGEISSPAYVDVEGWIFEIHENEIELLIRPVKRKR